VGGVSQEGKERMAKEWEGGGEEHHVLARARRLIKTFSLLQFFYFY
jgi:hypothetical protein